MKQQLITEKIWPQLTHAARRYKKSSLVAVAYFGKNGAAMLPLAEGSILVVDASDGAVRSGQTCPAELMKLYRAGVKIYKYSGLHAKVYLLGDYLFMGSPNVSRHAATVLQEAVIKTNATALVKKARSFILSLCNIPLGPEDILRLQQLYNEPKFFPLNLAKNKIYEGNDKPVHVFKLQTTEFTPEENRECRKGRTEARKKWIARKNFHMEDFLWDKRFSAAEGDRVLQIVEEGAATYVEPPGTIIHIRRWKNAHAEQAFFYVEVPDKKRKSITRLESQLKKQRIHLKHNGKKSKAFSASINKCWPAK